MSTELATELETNPGLKARRPWVVGLLSIVTLGIYSLVWYYRVNREMRDFGSTHGHQGLAASKPGKSLLAVTIGGLVVVPKVVSYLHTISRVQTIERICAGVSRPTTTVKTLLIGSVVTALGTSIRSVGPALALSSLAALSAGAAIIQARLNAACQESRVNPGIVDAQLARA
jgi:Domain of unknown function (DUF4234)